MKALALQRLQPAALPEIKTGRFIGVLVDKDTKNIVEQTALTYEKPLVAAESAYWLLVFSAQFYLPQEGTK